MAFGDAVKVGEDALYLLEIGLATAVEAHAATASVEQLGVEILLQGSDAVGDSGCGDAALGRSLDEALVAGRSLKETQAFERG